MPIHTPDTALQRVHHDLQRLSQNLAQLRHELDAVYQQHPDSSHPQDALEHTLAWLMAD
ncbi:MAG: hypothetical protein RI925_526 [Pseudomonadota bacterium]|jgi:uncharacterized membrane protein